MKDFFNPKDFAACRFVGTTVNDLLVIVTDKANEVFEERFLDKFKTAFLAIDDPNDFNIEKIDDYVPTIENIKGDYNTHLIRYYLEELPKRIPEPEDCKHEDKDGFDYEANFCQDCGAAL